MGVDGGQWTEDRVWPDSSLLHGICIGAMMSTWKMCNKRKLQQVTLKIGKAMLFTWLRLLSLMKVQCPLCDNTVSATNFAFEVVHDYVKLITNI
jgi:hypothetical protein